MSLTCGARAASQAVRCDMADLLAHEGHEDSLAVAVRVVSPTLRWVEVGVQVAERARLAVVHDEAVVGRVVVRHGHQDLAHTHREAQRTQRREVVVVSFEWREKELAGVRAALEQARGRVTGKNDVIVTGRGYVPSLTRSALLASSVSNRPPTIFLLSAWS